MQNLPPKLLRRERTFVVIFSALIAFSIVHFGHSDLLVMAEFQRLVHAPDPESSAVLYAPAAYRVAMPALLAALGRLLPTHDPLMVLAGVNFLLFWVSLISLYALAVSGLKGLDDSATTRSTRALHLALTFLFAVAALPWSIPYQRPETAPTVLYVLLAGLCLRRRSAWVVLVLLTVVQGFVRADVPFCFGLGTALAGLTTLRTPRQQGRNFAVLGLGVALVAGSAQGYLQFIRFPHLSYDPQTPVVVFWYNVSLHNLSNGLLAVLPVLCSVGYGLFVRRLPLRSLEERAFLFAAALFFPLWFTVGSLAEPRIYLPYLLLLSPLAARFVASSLEAGMSAPGHTQTL